MQRVPAVCHVHSDWSFDGKWPLVRLADAFSRRGYRVVLMTEHDQGFNEDRRLSHRQACLEASSDSILMVPGIEYSDAENRIHILVWGDVPFIGTGVPTERILDEAAEWNGVTVMAHPSRREAWRWYNDAWSAKLLGIELWNRKTDGWCPSIAARSLIAKTGKFPFVGLDFHTARQFFPLGSMLRVDDAVSEGAVLDALRSGRCDCSGFGLPTEYWERGVQATALHFAERLRRRAAAAYRRLG